MLHPHTRALLALIEASGLPPTHTLSPVDARAMYRERRYATQPPAPEMAEVREITRSAFTRASRSMISCTDDG